MFFAKKIFFVIIILLLLLPEFQAQFQIFKTKPLKGVFENTEPPVFTAKSWLDQNFQVLFAKNFDDSIGIKSDLVRLYNQVDFSLFKKVNASKIICGRNDYLFPVHYLDASAGKNFAGFPEINNHVRELKKLQDLLWNKYKIFFLVILCPDKPTFYPEYIPTRYQSKIQKINNVKYIAQRCEQEGVNMIDFNSYFLSIKKKLPFPLIPKTGVHWSYYGAYFAGDSLSKYLRQKSGILVPRIVLDSITVSHKPLGEDNDMGETMNLLWGIPNPTLGYPKFHSVVEPGNSKPSALFVGDSFYWNWLNGNMISSLFSNSDFWSYCKDVYPRNGNLSLSISDIDVEEVIKKQNFIILIQVNGAYGNPGYGFTELALNALDPVNSLLLKTERSIISHPAWLEDVQKKAKRNHLKFEDQLRFDALWILQQQKKQSKNKN